MTDQRLTADDIHHVCFAKPPFGKRGYNEDEVDAFLDALELKFGDPRNPQLAWLTPHVAAGTRFGRPPVGLRGYHKDQVDGFLDLCAAELHLLLRDGPGETTDPAPPVPRARSGFSADDIRTVAFGKPGFGRRGYSEAQVDDYLDALAAKFTDPHDPTVAWLTPAAIDEATFASSSFGQAGYRIDEVDAFLSRCRTELKDLLDLSAG